MRLRELVRGDLPALNTWRNDREVIDGLGAPFKFVGPEVDANWFTSYVNSRDRNVRLAIIDEDEEFVGCAYLLDISWVHRAAEFAIMIGAKDRWGRGLGRKAIGAALSHAFDDLQLNRVWLHVNHSNARALHLYESVGFRREGTLRNAVFKNGQYWDVEVMAILAGEHATANGR